MISKIRNWIVCWISTYYFDIHTNKDGIIPIPDHYGEYTCKRCGKIFKI